MANNLLFTLLSLFLASTVHASTLELLLREIEELDQVDRETEISKRVSDVMGLLTSPIERRSLVTRGVEGTMCEDGIAATCEGSVKCDASGTERCNPLCDSFDHGGKGHFDCRCNKDAVGQLCDVPRATAEAECKKCMADKAKDPKLCYPATSSTKGYFCYDKDYKVIWNDGSKREIEERDNIEGEKLGRIARVLHTYLDEES